MRAEATNTRLTIDLPAHKHRLVKAHATLNDLSIKDFILSMIDKEIGDQESPIKKEMNAKTIATIEHSIKNRNKLKAFNNSADAMKWLTSDDKVKKSKTHSTKKTNKKNEKNHILKPVQKRVKVS